MKVRRGKNRKRFADRSSQKVFLFVCVVRNGIIQLEKKFSISSWFSKTITVGKSRSCQLHLPGAEDFPEAAVFRISHAGTEVLLDPRLEGFLNNGTTYHDLRHFITPPGALARVTSIDDPLAIPLKNGARGVFILGGFEITFRVGHVFSLEGDRTLLATDGSRKVICLPPVDLPLERRVIPVAILASSFLIFPVLYWLLQFPASTEKGFFRLPHKISLSFIAPENLRYLPFIYGEFYQPEKTVPLALHWISALHQRWNYADGGKTSAPFIPFLQNAAPYKVQMLKKDWDQGVLRTYDKLTARKNAANAERYYSFQKPYPVMTTLASGSNGQSNTQLIARRVQQLEKVDAAILQYLVAEHETLQNLYKEKYESKKEGVVSPPLTGRVLGPQPDVVFQQEYQNYRMAESFATLATELRSRYVFLRPSHKSDLPASVRVAVGENHLILPLQHLRQPESQTRESIWHNAMYSAGKYILPPLPPPSPVIDMNMVRFVVFNKKAETEDCQKSSSWKGKESLKIAWTIQENGKATKFQMLKGGKQDETFFTCVVGHIQRWTFPKPEHGSIQVSFFFPSLKK